MGVFFVTPSMRSVLYEITCSIDRSLHRAVAGRAGASEGGKGRRKRGSEREGKNEEGRKERRKRRTKSEGGTEKEEVKEGEEEGRRNKEEERAEIISISGERGSKLTGGKLGDGGNYVGVVANKLAPN